MEISPMLAAAAVTFVGIVSLAFLIIAIQQQAEDRAVERRTMAYVLEFAKRYRHWSQLSSTEWKLDDGENIAVPKGGVRPTETVRTTKSTRQREEPKLGAQAIKNSDRKRAA